MFAPFVFMSSSGIPPGIYVPLLTPFNWEGDLYPAKVRHNVASLNLVDVAGYVVASEAGEGDRLTESERLHLLELVAEASREGRPRIAATQAASPHQALSVAQRAASLGYAALLLEPPAHLTPSERELLIGAIADRSPLPVIADATHPNITTRVTPGPIERLEAFALPVLANAVPYVYVTIWEALRTRESEAAADWQRRLQPAEAAFAAHGIAGLKSVMDHFRFYGGPVRLPRVPVSPATAEQVAAAFADLRG